MPEITVEYLKSLPIWPELYQEIYEEAKKDLLDDHIHTGGIEDDNDYREQRGLY